MILNLQIDLFLPKLCFFLILIFHHIDCCRSQALNLSIRPVYLGSNASPASSSKKPAAEKKPPPPPPKKKPVNKKLAKNKNFLCVPMCQKLCKPICRWLNYSQFGWIWTITIFQTSGFSRTVMATMYLPFTSRHCSGFRASFPHFSETRNYAKTIIHHSCGEEG